MNEKQKRKPTRPAQRTLIMRLIGGGYLVYLAYQMVRELTVSSGTRNLIQLSFTVLFFTTGILLAGWSIKKLMLREFLHPGEIESEAEQETGNDQNS